MKGDFSINRAFGYFLLYVPFYNLIIDYIFSSISVPGRVTCNNVDSNVIDKSWWINQRYASNQYDIFIKICAIALYVQSEISKFLLLPG